MVAELSTVATVRFTNGSWLVRIPPSVVKTMNLSIGQPVQITLRKLHANGDGDIKH